MLHEMVDKARLTAEIAKIIEQNGRMDDLEHHLTTSITRRSVGLDALIWCCRERKRAAAKVFGAELGSAILNLLEEEGWQVEQGTGAFAAAE